METIAFAPDDYNNKYPCLLDCDQYIQRDGVWLTIAGERYSVHAYCLMHVEIGTPIYDQLLKERNDK